ncbi:DUF29 domain-containing protein [Geminocystis sp. CENA526]|uniref:DUF29 domain-containing protein n=1 Tax=Geminocystis sp. CENA526 TaxID=1355871 RepID=UPI003D6FDB82
MVNTVLTTDLKSIYEIDEHFWLEETIKLLREKRFNELDLENLIEELESLARRDKSKVASLTEQIIRHLLLLQYWTTESEDNFNHWKTEIIGFRSQIKRDLTTNLTNYLRENLDSIYQDALRFVQQKTKYSVTFPDTCPYTLEHILDHNYYDR